MAANPTLIHWGKTVPSGLALTPAEICYAIAIVIIFAVYMRMRMLRNAAKAVRIVARNKDKIWSEERLKFGTADLFRDIRAAWSKGNLAAVQKHLEPLLYAEWSARLAGPYPRGGVHEASLLSIYDVEIMNAKDYLDNSKDEFTARISFSGPGRATGRTGSGITGERLFVEYWKMGRHKDAWRVREVMRDGVPAGISLALDPSVDGGGGGQ